MCIRDSSWSEEYQARLYRDNIRMFDNIPNLRGVSPWILFDFRSPFRFHPKMCIRDSFKGILMSDWTSVYSAVGAANAGLDLEMPKGRFMNLENLLPCLLYTSIIFPIFIKWIWKITVLEQTQ